MQTRKVLDFRKLEFGSLRHRNRESTRRCWRCKFLKYFMFLRQNSYSSSFQFSGVHEVPILSYRQTAITTFLPSIGMQGIVYFENILLTCTRHASEDHVAFQVYTADLAMFE